MKKERSTNHMVCIDCKSKEMLRNFFGTGYMVQDSIWEAITVQWERDKLICLSCAENRWGKPFVLSDFTDCILNQMNRHIKKLTKNENSNRNAR